MCVWYVFRPFFHSTKPSRMYGLKIREWSMGCLSKKKRNGIVFELMRMDAFSDGLTDRLSSLHQLKHCQLSPYLLRVITVYLFAS